MALDYSLYMVTDRSLLAAGSLTECVQGAVAGGATIVQLREKEATGRQFYELAVELKSVLDREHVPLIINDRIDIALAVHAAGVHLGQDDLPCREARAALGEDFIIGVSVGSAEEVREAERQGADYLGIGPVFSTATKRDAGQAIGVEGVKALSSATGLPAVAIGGISAENVSRLKGIGLAGVAVVSAIMCAADPQAEARRLKQRFLCEEA